MATRSPCPGSMALRRAGQSAASLVCQLPAVRQWRSYPQSVWKLGRSQLNRHPRSRSRIHRMVPSDLEIIIICSVTFQTCDLEHRVCYNYYKMVQYEILLLLVELTPYVQMVSLYTNILLKHFKTLKRLDIPILQVLSCFLIMFTNDLFYIHVKIIFYIIIIFLHSTATKCQEMRMTGAGITSKYHISIIINNYYDGYLINIENVIQRFLSNNDIMFIFNYCLSISVFW